MTTSSLMFKDPTTYNVKEKMTVGLWPPSIDNVADSLMPYINRLKVPTVRILIVGTFTGENAYRFLELDEKKKISEIVSLKVGSLEDAFIPIANENLAGKNVKIVEDVHSDEMFDVVFVDSESEIELDKLLRKYYNQLKIGGIICGNNHQNHKVKEKLSVFMKENKMGLSLQISNRSIWFWYKPAKRG